ncbi:DUF86 domain-containing protein [Spirochaetia bacterium]|nr:DUF86 domain-containing protein [Spirochaetia bacterium]
MQPNDRAYVWDMISAAEDIINFVKDMYPHEFSADKRTRFAVERQLLVIGEATKHISEEIKKEYPEIPWRTLKQLRNIIAHEYGEFLVERIWNIARKNIPELLINLKKINLDD